MTKRVALCFAGHIRDFQLCYSNIYENLINVLETNGYIVDTFISTWNNKGHRGENWVGQSDLQTAINLLKPKSILVEEFDREYFIKKYPTDRQMKYTSPETCGDAISMWYKLYTCYNMAKEYSNKYNFEYCGVVRIRFDMVFDTKFDIYEFNVTQKGNVLYIPEWHKKYYEICYTIMDQFAFGNIKMMEIYMSVYKNIDGLFHSGCPLTAEGFLHEHLKGVGTILRTNVHFSVRRENNRIEHVV